MKEQFKNIHQVISSFIELIDEEWANYSSMFKIKKKEIILHEGNICKDVFFINKGEEKTFHFAIENTFATDYKSFLKRIPSSYSMQALEDTQVVTMSLEMLLSGYEILKNGEKLGRLLAEDYLFMFNDKIQAIYTQTPLERYHSLTTSFPEIFQRVPQHLITSYLNISSVHLSRLKNPH